MPGLFQMARFLVQRFESRMASSRYQFTASGGWNTVGDKVQGLRAHCQILNRVTFTVAASAASCSCINTDEPVCEVATQQTLPNPCEAACRGAGPTVPGACKSTVPAPTPEFDCALEDCPKTSDPVMPLGSELKNLNGPYRA